MASKIYAKGLMNMLKTVRHLEEANMKVVLVDGTVTFNTAHDFYDDISAGVVDGTAAIALTSPAVTEAAGVVKFDAADTGLTWTAVSDANDVGAAIVYNDTGTPGTSSLIAFLDATDLVTNGSDVTLTFNASGIFTLNVA
jgi:uncharacterized protein (DUF1684 family)